MRWCAVVVAAQAVSAMPAAAHPSRETAGTFALGSRCSLAQQSRYERAGFVCVGAKGGGYRLAEIVAEPYSAALGKVCARMRAHRPPQCPPTTP
ncbi:MAG TPA: hypothetical protein VKS25_16280 [Solirubrobacteraceae bacterium]|nr:hypothetical protein [Solirubrobacteraceae bacterium]